MSTKSNKEIEDIRNKFQQLLEHRDEEEEIKHDTQMLMFRFLTEIQRFQDAEGITRKKLAESIKTSASYLTQIFRGNKPLNFETLAKCQKALNIRFEITAEPNFNEVELVDEAHFLQSIAKYKTPAGYWCYKRFDNPTQTQAEVAPSINTKKGQLKGNDSKKLVA